MRTEWQIAPMPEWRADGVIFFVCEDMESHFPTFARWMNESGKWLSDSTALKDFQGKFQQIGIAYGPPDAKMPRVICVGLGKLARLDADKLRSAMASAFRKCRELELRRPALPASAIAELPVEVTSALQEALIGGMGGLYRYDALKTRDLDPSTAPETIVLLAENEPGDVLRAAPPAAEASVSGIVLARDLTVAPSNRATPGYLVETARHLAETHGFRMQTIDREAAANLGMGAFLAVSQGSGEPAHIIILEHAPHGTEEDPPLVFVGKGITFDTGGISLKSSAQLDGMKQDMAGAAAVMGAFEALGRLNVPRRVVGIMPCTENMPGGKAFKPGDVIRSLSGLTVEVITTDAEGRMILCDALTYALRYKPALLVDIATLTGACIVALGNQVAAVMGNRENLNEKIREIGLNVGEKFWPLPLWDLYFEGLKSDVADFRNVADRSGGAIVAGTFLKQFVPNEIPWAHLDIAGTAWTDRDIGTAPRGATGFGVRMLMELARRWPDLGVS